MRTPRDTPEITLVGAGLAGSLLATFLARRGHKVSLFERRPDPRKAAAAAAAGRSINLALANRGIAALEEVGVMDRVSPALIPMVGRMLHDEDGGLKLIPYGNKPQEVIYSVSRAGLNALLLDAAESTGRVSIRFGEKSSRSTSRGAPLTASMRRPRPRTCGWRCPRRVTWKLASSKASRDSSPGSTSQTTRPGPSAR